MKAVLQLGDGEQVRLVGAQNAGADGALEDEGGVVPGLGRASIWDAGVLPASTQRFGC
jgi:hypothetical protein